MRYPLTPCESFKLEYQRHELIFGRYNTITAIVTGTVIIPASITVATGTTTVTDDIVVGTTPAPLNRREPVENSRIFRGKRDAAVVDEARIEKRNTFNLCSIGCSFPSMLTLR